MKTACVQIRDAVIAMLNEWIGDSGRVPVERLASAVVDTLTAPKMSPEVPPASQAAPCCRWCCTCCCGGQPLLDPESKLARSSFTVICRTVSDQHRLPDALCGRQAPGWG